MTVRVTTSLHPDLFAWLSQQAKKNNRSISNQIAWIIQKQYEKNQGEIR